MQQIVTLLGAKRSQGRLDNGTSYDSTKIYCQVRMNPNNPDMAGYSSIEYNWGNSDNFYKLRDLKFPCSAEITLEMVSNGKTSVQIVTDVNPLDGFDIKTLPSKEKDKA